MDDKPNTSQSSQPVEAVHGAPQDEDRKAWARRTLRGVETFVLPSFTPDLRSLDEAGIRADVRHAADQGFLSVLPTPVGLSSAESDQLSEIVADEARRRDLLTVTSIYTTARDTQAAQIKRAEQRGCTHAILLNDNKLESQEEIYRRMAAVIGQTSMAVVLYASPHPNIAKLDPTGVPLEAFDRLADLPNVVAIKLTQDISPAAAFEVANRVGDRLLIGPVQLALAPLLAEKYPMQWSGQWAIDALQSPGRRLAVEFMGLMGEGKIREAMRVYWEMHPAAQSFYSLQRASLSVGGHPWNHIKYYQWLTGGNGGVMRDLNLPVEAMPPLDAAGRQHCRDGMRSSGLAVTDLPEEAFIIGNAAYAAGARVSSGATIPQYV